MDIEGVVCTFCAPISCSKSVCNLVTVVEKDRGQLSAYFERGVPIVS